MGGAGDEDGFDEENGGRAGAFASGRAAPRMKHGQDWFQGNQHLQQPPASTKKKKKRKKKQGKA